MTIPVLFATIVNWAYAHGADNISALPGLWTGETDQWSVKINGHANEIEDVPPFSILAQHKTALVGMAIVSVNGGCVAGPTEEELIAHFKGATDG